MKAALVICILGLVAMTAALAYGFGWGGGWAEVQELAGYPWFLVSIVDVYVGFALFGCWIGMREKPLIAACWIIALLALGNLIACLYAILAIVQSRCGKRDLMGRDLQPA